MSSPIDRSSLVSAVIVLFASSDAHAWCYARLGGVGPQVPVQERTGASPHWAHSYFDPFTGHPTIVYGDGYFMLPPIMQKFTRHHECGHLVLGTRDEIAANCFALRRMRRDGMTYNQEKMIAEYHKSLGWLPLQYGGSGEAFWNMTVRHCG